MIVEIAKIPPEGLKCSGAEPASILGMEDADRYHLEEPFQYDLTVLAVSDRLIARGALSVSVQARCSKCAAAFAMRVTEPSFECVEELAEGVESVDLTERMREAMLLAFPAFPVCRPHCRGLCPQCGVNLNEGSCDCGPPADSCWGALDNLMV